MTIDISKIKAKGDKSFDLESQSWLDRITSVLNKDISFSGANLSSKKKESFYMELSVLLSSGIDIKSSLEMIADEQEKAKDKLLFGTIKDQVINGLTFSEALNKSGKFSLYEFYAIQIGEETGRLTTVLEELSLYYQKRVKQQRQLISALTYPCIVLTVALGSVFFMLNYIVPMFADVFKRFGGELPGITMFIVNLSNGVGKNVGWFFLVFTLLISYLYMNRNKMWFKKYTAYFLLHVPLFGEMFRKIYLARFCHSMNLLISSRIPLLRALTMVRQMIDFYPIKISLEEIEKKVLQGESLNRCLSEYKFYPKRMVSLVKVGEEVNQLDTFFNKIAKQYSDEVEHQTSVISSMIEPIMIIFLGFVVGFILIAMYLPLFQLSTSF